jgi:hypothetical protein
MPDRCGHTVLIKPSRQAHWIAELTAKQALFKPGVWPLQSGGGGRQGQP